MGNHLQIVFRRLNLVPYQKGLKDTETDGDGYAAIITVKAPVQAIIFPRIVFGIIRFIIELPRFHQYYIKLHNICQTVFENMCKRLNTIRKKCWL